MEKALWKFGNSISTLDNRWKIVFVYFRKMWESNMDIFVLIIHSFKGALLKQSTNSLL